MSGHVTALVLEHKFPNVPANPGAGYRRGVTGKQMKYVLVGIASRARDDGTGAHPSYRWLARVAECHTDTVRCIVAAAIDTEYLSITTPGDKRNPHTYALNLARLNVIHIGGRPGERGRSIAGPPRYALEDGSQWNGSRWVHPDELAPAKHA